MIKPPKFVTLSQIEAREIDWLWHPYIPRSALSIMEGDPDVGKSYLAMHLAALVTVGGKLPDGTTMERGRVLYITSEDDAGITLRPRIEAMGGNVARVRVLEGLLNFNEEGLELIREEMDAKPADLVVVDTLFSFLPDGVDLSKPSAVRAQLHALEHVLKPYECAVLLIRHWTKGSKGKAIYRGGGLIDFIGVARTAMAVARHPADPDLRVFAQVKNNIGPRADSLVFQLVKRGKDRPVVEWKGKTDLTADDLEGVVGVPEKPINEAETFLRKQLQGGAKPAVDVLRAAERYSFSQRTIERAKKALGVKSQKQKDGWMWSLPDSG